MADKALPRAHPETDFGVVGGPALRRAKHPWGHAPVQPTMCFPFSMEPGGKTGPFERLTVSPSGRIDAAP